jgi:beta-xylosidase
MPDGTIRMVLCSFDEDLNRGSYSTKMTILVKSNKSLRSVRYWLVDEDHGNIYKKWKELGKPNATNTKARQVLLKASKYAALEPPTVNYDPKNITNTINLRIRSSAVVFLELK